MSYFGDNGYFWDGNLCSNPEARFEPDYGPGSVVFIGYGAGGQRYMRVVVRDLPPLPHEDTEDC